MQVELFHENLNDACNAAVTFLGGYKRVGPMLWPELATDTAANRLRDCLNASRRDVLHPDQLLFLMRTASAVGCHAIAVFMLRDCGYEDPKPIAVEDQKAALMRQFNDSVQTLARIAMRIEATGQPKGS